MRNILFIFFIITTKVWSQDIRGAYLRTEWVTRNDFLYEYKITVSLFTDASMNVPRPTIRVNFGYGGSGGSGTFSLSSIVNQNGISIKTYSATHIFPGSSGQSYYQVSYQDSFRVAGIKDMSNSEYQKIYVESKIFANEISRANHAVQVNNFPFNNLSLEGNHIIYDPACTDADGDSISYELINCIGQQYYIPSGAAVNYSTGVISVPKDSLGLYAYSLRINEFEKDLDGFYVYAHTTWMDFTLDITTDVGVKENKAMERYWKISPNPFSDKLSIKPLNTNKNINALSILNALGQIVFIQKTISGEQQLDLEFLPPGVYSLKLETSEGSSVKKIIKE